jgi:hypothetical protein
LSHDGQNVGEGRPYLADRLALSLINRKQVSPAGFTTAEGGAVSMDEATCKAVLVAWQKRKQEQVVHPFLGEKVSVGLLVRLQARLLARRDACPRPLIIGSSQTRSSIDPAPTVRLSRR